MEAGQCSVASCGDASSSCLRDERCDVLRFTAEILSYSRTQGLFAGINLSGGVLRPDRDDNKDLYGVRVTGTEVLLGESVPISTIAEPVQEPSERASLRLTVQLG